MRIVCPSCSAAYDVPDSLVTVGRTVRCARCGGDWTPVETHAPAVQIHAPEAEPPAAIPVSPAAEPPPPAPFHVPAADAADVPVPSPGLSAMERLAARPAATQSQLRLRLAWAASVLLLALAIFGAVTWQTQIVNAWPPSGRVYATFGMHPDRSSTQ